MLEAYLEQLAIPNFDQRRLNLTEQFRQLQLPFSVQEGYADGQTVHNLIVALDDDPQLLVAIDYSSFNGALGANDNASGLAVALGILQVFSFARRTSKRTIPLWFLFYEGSSGAKAYLDLEEAPKTVLNLTWCGVGDTVALHAIKANATIKNTIKNLLNSERYPDVVVIDALPPLTINRFSDAKIPTLILTVMPHDDIELMSPAVQAILKDKPIKNAPALFETLAGGRDDQISTIQLDALRHAMLVANGIITDLTRRS